jgi:hypothetical protein
MSPGRNISLASNAAFSRKFVFVALSIMLIAGESIAASFILTGYRYPRYEGPVRLLTVFPDSGTYREIGITSEKSSEDYSSLLIGMQVQATRYGANALVIVSNKDSYEAGYSSLKLGEQSPIAPGLGTSDAYVRNFKDISAKAIRILEPFDVREPNLEFYNLGNTLTRFEKRIPIDWGCLAGSWFFTCVISGAIVSAEKKDTNHQRTKINGWVFVPIIGPFLTGGNLGSVTNPDKDVYNRGFIYTMGAIQTVIALDLVRLYYKYDKTEVEFKLYGRDKTFGSDFGAGLIFSFR